MRGMRDVAAAEDDGVGRRARRQGEVAGAGDGGGEERRWSAARARPRRLSTTSITAIVAVFEATAESATVARLASSTWPKRRQAAHRQRAARPARPRGRSSGSPPPWRSRRPGAAASPRAPGRSAREAEHLPAAASARAAGARAASTAIAALDVRRGELEGGDRAAASSVGQPLAGDPQRRRRPGRRRARSAPAGCTGPSCAELAARPPPPPISPASPSRRPIRQSIHQTTGRKSSDERQPHGQELEEGDRDAQPLHEARRTGRWARCRSWCRCRRRWSRRRSPA